MCHYIDKVYFHFQTKKSKERVPNIKSAKFILIFEAKKLILIRALFKYGMIHYYFIELLEEKNKK
jgi:hypothetical protein